MNHPEIFKFLLSSQEVYIIKNVMKFIFYVHKKRQDILGDAAVKKNTRCPSPSLDTNLNIWLMCV